ncbi:endoplasmic reticulum-based factor for assembly of V-ATPase-domain-containing protein [Pilobolus umbonatus]|nr:endoplasmic reticulum-based factor for assembly of V-ATPase-domain-containing protein [Pilobolus umbonatus]
MKLTLTRSMQDLMTKGGFPDKYIEEIEEIQQVDLEKTPHYPVSYELVIEAAKINSVYLHELMKNSQVYIPPKEVKPKNPEFEAFMNKLREEQEKKRYNEMVSSVLTSDEQKFNLGISHDEIKEIKHHVVTIFNIGFSMVAVFLAVYKASQTITHDYGMQLLMSLGGALFICIVEVILYLRYSFTIIPTPNTTTKMSAI